MAVLVPIFGSQGSAGGLTITIGLTGQLNDLDDVIINNPQTSQALIYNGYVWTNEDITTSTTTSISGFQIQVQQLSGSLIAETDNRQNTDNFLQHQINELAVGYRLVFCENFTGNGVSNTFQINGNITNAQFISGGWSTSSVLNSLPVNITDMNGKPIYDGSILSLFTRNRITVSNLNGSGLGTLDYIPLNNQQYKIWYWYELTPADRIDNYYRDDFVASMEETDGKLASSIAVDTSTFTTVLSSSDINAQLAFNRLDKHNHNTLYYTKSEVRDITGNIQSQLYYISGDITDIYTILNDQQNSLNYLTTITGQFALNSTVLGLTDRITSLENTVSQLASTSGAYTQALTAYALNGNVQAMSAGLDTRLVTVENTNNAQQTTLSQLTSITGNVPTISSLDSRFVNVTGDSMFGILSMSGASIDLDITHVPIWKEGRVFYDVVQHTLSYYNDNSEVRVNVGQEQLVRVRNSTLSTILNGKVVCISGSTGSHPNIILASNASLNADSTIGLATHDININEDGYVTVQGLVNGLNTSMYSTEGVILWLDNDGNLTETKPTAPNAKIRVGYVIRKHNNLGSILVSINLGLHINDLSDVSTVGASSGSMLTWDGSVWGSTKNINSYALNSNVQAMSAGLDSRIDLLEEINYADDEPTGFENRTDSIISYNPLTQTFDLSGNYNIWAKSVKYEKTGESAVLTPSYGMQFIKYDSNGVFNISTSPWDLFRDVPIAYAFFNSDLSDSLIAEERHGITMDGATHYYLHFTQGSKYKDGFSVGGYTLNSDITGSNTYSVEAGNFFDEDIINSVPELVDGGPYTILYRTGASGEWTWSKTETYPYFINANSIRYNAFTGATWQLTNITTNNRWVNYYVFATNALTDKFKIVIIPGQAIYTTLAAAQAESVGSLLLGSLPFQEIIAVAKVTHQFSTGYATANGRARIVQVSSLLNQSVTVLQATSNHNSLSGLQGGTAGEYFHLTASEYSDLIGITEVSSISAGLSDRITIENTTNNDQQNTLSQLTSITGDYSLSSTVISMSAGLDTRLVIVENTNIDQQNTLSQLTSITGNSGNITIIGTNGITATNAGSVWTIGVTGKQDTLNVVSSTIELSGSLLRDRLVTKTFSYDISGNISSISSAIGNRYFYFDIDGNLTSISGTGLYGSKTFSYDVSGYLTNIYEF